MAEFIMPSMAKQESVKALSEQIGTMLMVGTPILISLDITTTGNQYVDFTPPTPPTGYTLIGYEYIVGSYRACILGIGNIRCYYYVGSTSSTSLSVNLYPVFKKQ